MAGLFVPEWLSYVDFLRMYPNYSDTNQYAVEQALRQSEIVVEALASGQCFSKSDRVLLAGYKLANNILVLGSDKDARAAIDRFTSVSLPDVSWQRDSSFYTSNPALTQEILDLLSDVIDGGPAFYNTPVAIPGDALYGGLYDVDYTMGDRC